MDPKIPAAKRGMKTILDPRMRNFRDPVSGVSLGELYAMIYCAINDDEIRIGTLVNAQRLLVETLYEVQRGNNLSYDNRDLGESDDVICCSGAFNKIVEKFQGIVLECQIKFITPEVAGLKLPVVVREVLKEHLSELKQRQTAKTWPEFLSLLNQLQKDGIEMIWHEVKDSVADKMFEEFQELYEGRDDSSFIELLKTGVYVNVIDLTPFRKSPVQQLREGRLSFFNPSANVASDQTVGPEAKDKNFQVASRGRSATG